MKEADLFRQYAQEAARSSSNATSQEEKRCSNAACLHMGSSGVNEREGAGVKQLHSSPHYPSLRETHPVF
jgi:hypothetical protein